MFSRNLSIILLFNQVFNQEAQPPLACLLLFFPPIFLILSKSSFIQPILHTACTLRTTTTSRQPMPVWQGGRREAQSHRFSRCRPRHRVWHHRTVRVAHVRASLCRSTGTNHTRACVQTAATRARHTWRVPRQSLLQPAHRQPIQLASIPRDLELNKCAIIRT